MSNMQHGLAETVPDRTSMPSLTGINNIILHGLSISSQCSSNSSLVSLVVTDLHFYYFEVLIGLGLNPAEVNFSFSASGASNSLNL